MDRLRKFVFRNVPVLLLVFVFVVFTMIDNRFFDLRTLSNVVMSASYIGIVAVGMTLVLMTAGIDMSSGRCCT